MPQTNINPTRIELKKLKARLITARRGHKLLKDKRDELMKQFLSVVREEKALRELLDVKFSAVQGSFAVASATMNPLILTESLMLPKTERSLRVEEHNLMSVIVPHFIYDGGGAAEGCNYGFAFTSGELDSAVSELESITSELIRLAELNKAAELMADEIEKTRRRVNALENIMIPQIEASIRSITMKLDENERGNTTRLMKVKDMMVKKQLEARRARELEHSPVQ